MRIKNWKLFEADMNNHRFATSDELNSEYYKKRIDYLKIIISYKD